MRTTNERVSIFQRRKLRNQSISHPVKPSGSFKRSGSFKSLDSACSNDVDACSFGSTGSSQEFSLSSREFRTSNKYSLIPEIDLVQSSHERHKQDKIKQAIPSTRLQFERVGLCGRNEEIKKLRSCLSRAVDTSTSRNELILLGGESGSGKSSLAFQLQAPVENIHKGIFGTGKHEQSKKDVPMLGLIGATTQICQKVLALQETNPSLLHTIQNEMKVLIGEAGLGLLSPVIGDIPKILNAGNGDHHNLQTNSKDNRRLSMGKNQNQKVECAFRILFRILCSHLSPIVMMLDDLQWCSDFRIVNALLNDSEISGLIIVGCYRSNEVEPDGALSRFIQGNQSHPDLSFTEIDVGNLSRENTQLWLSELLSKDQKEVDDLACLCHSRTQGNVFFMKSFLSLLVEDGMMRFDVGSFKWDWCVQAIKDGTSVAPNLVEVIQNRMAKLHHGANELLTIASCLGAFFDRDTLWLVWKKAQNREQLPDAKLFETILDIVVQANCLEKAGEVDSSEPSKNACLYHFSHDKIQEAAISSIPLEDYQNLQHTVGTILLCDAQPNENDPMYYLITDLLNVKAQENIELAEMNLKAALAAKSFAAFICTAKYVRYGIRCLPAENMWESHLELAGKLHSLGAVAEINLGNMDAAEQFCMTVIEQDEATPLQKCTAYHVKVLLSQNAGMWDESLDLCLDYLAKLGCKFNNNKFVRKVQAGGYLEETISKYMPTPEEIHHMPAMTDPIKVESRYLLEEAGSLAYMKNDIDLYIMIRCRYIRWIKKYGLTDDAANAFASFANVLMHVHGDFDTARSMAELSLALQDMVQDKYAEARTLHVVHFNTLSWIQPLKSQLQPCLTGYRSGMKSGNTYSACVCIATYLFLSFQSGTKLSLLEEDFSNFIAELERRGMAMPLKNVLPIGQIVENLLGKSRATTTITGSIMDEEQFKKSCHAFSLGFFWVYKCLNFAFFGDFESGANLALKMGIDSFRKFPGCGSGFEYLPFGLCLFAAYRKTKQSKFKRPALQVREQLKKLVGKGCVNLVHHLSLLDAEYYALNKKTEKATDAYYRAVTEAARGGFLQDAALVNERYAHFLLELGDSVDASYRMNEAVKCYSEWGATKKVELLLEEHKELLKKANSP